VETAAPESEHLLARRPERAGRRSLSWLGTLPFFAYVGLFLLLPTGIVVWGGISNGHGLDLGNLKVLGDSNVRTAFWHSIELCAITAAIGAVAGAVLAYAVATGNPNGLIRRVFLSGSGVLAQFGGVTLAFAFTAAIGPTSGFLFHASWFYNFPIGIGLIYIYFQIPLMLLVFVPALVGLKKEWREATENLGGSTWDYWRLVGFRLLLPAFLGATLLLFANALSAYATIQAWENQIPYVVPQLISNSITSEVGLASTNEAQALALGMVVLVAIVMTCYVLLQRRTSRWLR
jgi:putative spermidine/putrescine transport system permease protein